MQKEGSHNSRSDLPDQDGGPLLRACRGRGTSRSIEGDADAQGSEAWARRLTTEAGGLQGGEDVHQMRRREAAGGFLPAHQVEGRQNEYLQEMLGQKISPAKEAR